MARMIDPRPQNHPFTHAMILAAGLGRRMRPLSDTCPKVLMDVCGRPIIDHLFDRLEAAGITSVVVNTHHLGDMIADHIATRSSPHVVISPEPTLLGTAGGVINALPHLGEDPIVVINGDVVWLDGTVSAFHRLAEVFDPERMDGLLMCQHAVRCYGYSGYGDFRILADGAVQRREERKVSPYVYTGVQVVTRRLLDGFDTTPLSFNDIWDRAIEQGRLYGMVNDGLWCHVGTPEGLEDANDLLNPRGSMWMDVQL